VLFGAKFKDECYLSSKMSVIAEGSEFNDECCLKDATPAVAASTVVPLLSGMSVI